MSQTAQFEPIVVADIGGTNARFALVTDHVSESNQFVVSHHRIFPSSNYNSLEGALADYLSELGRIKPSRACLAVAGPIKSGQVQLTNLGWHFGIAALKQEFKFEQLAVINDFAAFAYAAPYLDKEQNITVKSGQADVESNIAVFGPGTGFGAAALVRSQGQQAVLSCEAGHISLAPVTELDHQLLKALREEVQHVSVENVFSGPGLARLYRAMAAVRGETPQEIDAAKISQLAEAGECDLCEATLNHFCDWIGSVAGDLALTFGALGGVYIGGGILPRMTHRLLASRFVERFNSKGLMSQYNGQIPVTLVTQDDIPFIGAAACLHNLH